MKKFRPSGIRIGLKFLLQSIHCSYADLEFELEDYRVTTEREEKAKREKRRNNLEKIRNKDAGKEIQLKKFVQPGRFKVILLFISILLLEN